MKVLIATGLYPPESGGPATYTKLLEDRLPARGIAVSVLPFSSVRRLPKGIRHLAYALKLFGKARHADAVYAQDTVSVGLPAALVAQLLRKKFLVRVPGDYAWEQACQRFGVTASIEAFQTQPFGWRVELLRAVQSFVVKRAARVIVPSAYLQKIVAGWGVQPQRLVRIFNGIELPIKIEKPLTRPAGFLIVSVGRLVPWKGMDGIIRVAAQEKDWQVIIVGAGPEEKKLRVTARKLKCEDRVQFTGQADRAKALGFVAAADVFVLNSSYEGLSHLLIEAMSLGVPVVATSVGGNPEVLTDGKEGLLVEQGDGEALLGALRWVQAHKRAAHTLGARAALRAKTFSIDRTLDQLCELLNTL